MVGRGMGWMGSLQPGSIEALWPNFTSQVSNGQQNKRWTIPSVYKIQFKAKHVRVFFAGN